MISINTTIGAVEWPWELVDIANGDRIGHVMDKLVEKTETDLKSNFQISKEMSEKIFVIPPARTRYSATSADRARVSPAA